MWDYQKEFQHIFVDWFIATFAPRKSQVSELSMSSKQLEKLRNSLWS